MEQWSDGILGGIGVVERWSSGGIGVVASGS